MWLKIFTSAVLVCDKDYGRAKAKAYLKTMRKL